MARGGRVVVALAFRSCMINQDRVTPGAVMRARHIRLLTGMTLKGIATAGLVQSSRRHIRPRAGGQRQMTGHSGFTTSLIAEIGTLRQRLIKAPVIDEWLATIAPPVARDPAHIDRSIASLSMAADRWDGFAARLDNGSREKLRAILLFRAVGYRHYGLPWASAADIKVAYAAARACVVGPAEVMAPQPYPIHRFEIEHCGQRLRLEAGLGWAGKYCRDLHRPAIFPSRGPYPSRQCRDRRRCLLWRYCACLCRLSQAGRSAGSVRPHPWHQARLPTTYRAYHIQPDRDGSFRGIALIRSPDYNENPSGPCPGNRNRQTLIFWFTDCLSKPKDIGLPEI